MLGEGVFVAAGAVDAGDGDAEFAQVDAELAAVMDRVVQDQDANGGYARQRKDGLAFENGAPHSLRRFGSESGYVGFERGDALIEMF